MYHLCSDVFILDENAQWGLEICHCDLLALKATVITDFYIAWLADGRSSKTLSKLIKREHKTIQSTLLLFC